MPELELASPPAATTFNIDAAEWQPQPLPSSTANATSLNVAAAEWVPPTKKATNLSVDAPAFCPLILETSAPSAPMSEPPPAIGVLRAQMQRMARELEACQKRAASSESALAAVQSQRREEGEGLERELAQMRLASTASCAALQKEQRVAEDLRVRLGNLSDAVCDLHEQKETMGNQLAAQQRAWFEQRAECERLEARLRARNDAVAMPPLPSSMPLPTHNVFGMMPPPTAMAGPPLPPAATPTPTGPGLVAAVAALQQEMANMHSSVVPPGAPAVTSDSSFEECEEGDAADGEAGEGGAPRIRTSRSRRGGRGKGKKAAAAAAAEALKENAANAFNVSANTYQIGEMRRAMALANPHGRVVTIG